MLCDELKWKWAYGPYLDPPEGQKESAIKAGYVKVVSKQSADAAIAELKQKLEDAKATAYADSELSGKCYEASVRYIEKIERIKAGIKETPMAHHLKPKFEFAGSYGYDKDEVDELIAAKDAQILDLIEQVQKERSAKVDYKISANDLSDGLKKAYEKIRSLKRALYKACANWAHAELMWACLLDFKCPEDWDEMERKCRAMAERYGEGK